MRVLSLENVRVETRLIDSQHNGPDGDLPHVNGVHVNCHFDIGVEFDLRLHVAPQGVDRLQGFGRHLEVETPHLAEPGQRSWCRAEDADGQVQLFGGLAVERRDPPGLLVDGLLMQPA